MDVCSLCRPFDEQNMLSIRLETDAVFLILAALKQGRDTMIVSPVHYREIEAINEPKERVEIIELLINYGRKPSVKTSTFRTRAEDLYSSGFGVADAAHVAYAEATAEVFISCDQPLLRKCKRYCSDLVAVNPVDFCRMEDLR